MGGFGVFLISILIIVMLLIGTTLFLEKILKAYKTPDSEIREQLLHFCKQAELERKALYMVNEKNKVTNALVTGITRKKHIYITDY
ncbi:hypothetical protein BKP45_10660 [Anaerobacillus alkalidiazotrophicus]|uniref:Uncharacterized protein n=1 Tax=Anaerobacillus alkalidiazotrophicus TaxID=472963 RepID=A0A1S2M355_9BACI|nr:hypothetical protein [Anaerobacillus alkalidiazotrophicus]OIJ18055.1 hypothetical protein BKP45_16375 [Anaerobacillus alkalidiazotrophicus]OIJ19534.1 hypothetical protein BKP45_10660 [Anaerobacillus alkalidiazotrophicus]